MVHMVSLPSIHEGFPDLDFKDPPPLGPHSVTIRPQPISDPRSPIHNPHGRTRRSSYSSPKPYERHADYPPPATRRRSSSHIGRHHPSDSNEIHYRDTVTSSSRYLPQPSPRGTHPPSHTLPPPEYAGPNGSSRHPTTKSSPSSPKGTHSFDVLRSDPGTVSLEHIASSKTLQNRVGVGGGVGIKPASPTGIANGSAPAFRVTLTHPPHPPPPTSSGRYEGVNVNTSLETIPRSRSSRTFPSTHGGPSERETTFRSDEDPAGGGGGSSEYPSLVAFSMLDGSSVSKLTVDGNGRSHFEEIGEGGGGGGGGGGAFRLDGRGKKHQCPQCSKRFNRPSSLRIHVNTHTGARPFQCPYPNCGREFNVNSNMRRHYRNHSIPATDEVHPPRHNSGRRPQGYSRPHPGRNSNSNPNSNTTVFHITTPGGGGTTELGSAGGSGDHSPRSSASDDDEDVSGSEFDGEDAVDNTRRINWSRSPSQSPTSAHQEWPHGYDLYHHHSSLGVSPACSESNPNSHHSSPTTTTTTRSYYSPSILGPVYAQSYRCSEISTTLRPAFH